MGDVIHSTAIEIARLRTEIARLTQALRLADAAMNYMGDRLNDMSACEEEDERACELAFASVREALGYPLPGDAEIFARHLQVGTETT